MPEIRMQIDSPVPTRRAFADTPLGQIHYAEAGEGNPVLFLHETPRSWDQFRDVLPLVGGTRRAIAMDTVGFGDSCQPRGDEATIEAYAEGVHALLDALELPQVDLVGHHTGGVVAVEVAATTPERIRTLVLSSTGLMDELHHEESKKLGIDEADRSEDGAHLGTLWTKRHAGYPEEGRTELLERFIVDAVKCGKHAAGGHHACGAYEMEPRLANLSMPLHVIIGNKDAHAQRHGPRLVDRTNPLTVEVIEEGHVPLPEQLPEEFAAAVLAALDRSSEV